MGCDEAGKSPPDGQFGLWSARDALAWPGLPNRGPRTEDEDKDNLTQLMMYCTCRYYRIFDVGEGTVEGIAARPKAD
jgi:hypothetical protein